jgi:membrane fusion protein (multidrug efflux system)
VQSLKLAASRLESEQQKNDNDRTAQINRLEGEIVRLESEKSTASRTVERLTHEAGRRVVRAPVARRLGEVEILRNGAFVNEGEKLATVVPQGAIRLVGEFLPLAALGRIRGGQRATFRLHGFPWAQYGAIDAAVVSTGREVRDGRVRVELSVVRAAALIPLQHGLPGTLEIHVEDLTPAELVLRAAGRMIAAQRTERAT